MIASKVFVLHYRWMAEKENRWFCSNDYAPFRNGKVAEAFCRELEKKYPGYQYKAVEYIPNN
jgi:hypothetical protein